MSMQPVIMSGGRPPGRPGTPARLPPLPPPPPPANPPPARCPRRCDEQILPAVYSFVGASFGATPAQLGYITLGRALMQALSSPLGGVAGAAASDAAVVLPLLGHLCWLGGG